MGYEYVLNRYQALYKFAQDFTVDKIPSGEKIAEVVPPTIFSRIFFKQSTVEADFAEVIEYRIKTTSESELLRYIVMRLVQSYPTKELRNPTPDDHEVVGHLIIALARFYSNPKNLDRFRQHRENGGKKRAEVARKQLEPEQPLDPIPPLLGETKPRTRKQLLSYIRFSGTIVSPRDLAVILKVVRQNVFKLNEDDLRELAKRCVYASNQLDETYLTKILGIDGLTGNSTVDQKTIDNLRNIAQAYLDSLLD